MKTSNSGRNLRSGPGSLEYPQQMPDIPQLVAAKAQLADFQNTLWIMPAVLGIGTLATLALKERAPTGGDA